MKILNIGIKSMLIILLFTSCTMRSGRYVKKNNQWTFVTNSTGFKYYYNTSAQDNTQYTAEPGKFLWPVPSSQRLSSYYGPRSGRHHDGVDIPARRGSHILAAGDGRVIHAGRLSGYGRVVIVDHGDGFHTVYAHNQSNLVRKNQKVSRGEVIGKVGSSGRSTGPHLHFEIRKNNKVRDPALYMDKVRRLKLAKR